mmetsp:Transcript_40831/g.92765  ORF Transcript_40831/g.92765 Transcript_40831/m.92765 type:complete len:244 (-) Transcript_40831:137-868(-)
MLQEAFLPVAERAVLRRRLPSTVGLPERRARRQSIIVIAGSATRGQSRRGALRVDSSQGRPPAAWSDEVPPPRCFGQLLQVQRVHAGAGTVAGGVVLALHLVRRAYQAAVVARRAGRAPLRSVGAHRRELQGGARRRRASAVRKPRRTKGAWPHRACLEQAAAPVRHHGEARGSIVRVSSGEGAEAAPARASRRRRLPRALHLDGLTPGFAALAHLLHGHNFATQGDEEAVLPLVLLFVGSPA